MNSCDSEYLKSYAIEHLTDLFEREKHNCFENLFNHGDEFGLKFGTRKHRMYFIDRIFSVAAQPEMQMADKSVVYQAISFFDRYFHSTAQKYHEIKAEPLPRDDFRTIGMRDVRTFEDFMKMDAFRLKPDELYQLRQGTYSDLIAAGYTGFFLASKNTAV